MKIVAQFAYETFITDHVALAKQGNKALGVFLFVRALLAEPFISTLEGSGSIPCWHLDWAMRKFPPIYGPHLCIHGHQPSLFPESLVSMTKLGPSVII